MVSTILVNHYLEIQVTENITTRLTIPITCNLVVTYNLWNIQVIVANFNGAHHCRRSRLHGSTGNDDRWKLHHPQRCSAQRLPEGPARSDLPGPGTTAGWLLLVGSCGWAYKALSEVTIEERLGLPSIHQCGWCGSSWLFLDYILLKDFLNMVNWWSILVDEWSIMVYSWSIMFNNV